MFDNFKDVLTVQEVAKALGIGKNATYNLIHTGEIKSKTIAGKFLIPKICLIDFINSVRQQPITADYSFIKEGTK